MKDKTENVKLHSQVYNNYKLNFYIPQTRMRGYEKEWPENEEKSY